jgi:hypothetical protein
MTKLIATFLVGIVLVIAAGQAIRSASTETGPVLAEALSR